MCNSTRVNVPELTVSFDRPNPDFRNPLPSLPMVTDVTCSRRVMTTIP